MHDLLYSMFQGSQAWGMIVSVVFLGCLAGVIGAIAKEARKYACHRKDVELKRDLVERGLSVDEIERIVYSGPSQGGNTNLPS